MKLNKNTIVTQLGRTASRWQHCFLKELGLKVFHEPTGGWPANQFDMDLSWSHYLNTRMSCRASNFPEHKVIQEKFDGMDLRDVINNREYIEVGYASLPYLENIPMDWRILGVVRHPTTWVRSAVTYQFYKPHLSWEPTKYEDYARIWFEYNSRILDRADRVWRMEDLEPFSELFAQEFGYFHKLTERQKDCYVEWRSDDAQKRHQGVIDNDDESWWPIVADLAERFGYEPMGQYQLEDRSKSVVIREMGVDKLTTHFKSDY